MKRYLNLLQNLSISPEQLNPIRIYDKTNLIYTNHTYSIHNNDKGVFIYTQVLSELRQNFPVAQVRKVFQFALKPEEPGLSSSICLKVMCI